ncbi:uncharacterized protein LOC102152579 [Canis lupus familiaris]|uniref:uncharacterized protein LOC102152579 n=1 Tax=Canis lupus familiaris TaxID=9615 RepID=UPI0003ADD296|nr:uncharacterized protein LOC102152579 [Canis lupus familiaris]XP_038412755.1 uncharacterized protein LOC102152579 [Canis lupus familiaris]XP_038542376.1 uncharacterized protein LOC102152579 [Canis lupus familiaris]|eukprot:XP_022283053.1 uncharacterized protein LOC102152579 [Canis lupus familiaris]
MSARRGTQWNGRGRAEQPRVCRERGGGEVPGTSMSRLNIYPYIIVLHCYPPRPPGPGRAGRGAPGCRGAFGGCAQAAVEGLWVHPCGAAECGWGLPGPCNPMLGVCEEGWSDICWEIASFLSTFSFSARRHLKTTCTHKWSFWGKEVWTGNEILPPTRRTSLVETHEVGEGWGSRYSGVEERWGPRGGSRPKDRKGGRTGYSSHFGLSSPERVTAGGSRNPGPPRPRRYIRHAGRVSGIPGTPRNYLPRTAGRSPPARS